MLALQNKCNMPHPLLSSSQFSHMILITFKLHKQNCVDPDQLASSEASWSGSSLFSLQAINTGPHSAVGNVSDYRCISDCRYRGRRFDPNPVAYFCGDWLWNNFYSHSPLFCWFIQNGVLSVTSKSMCTSYWLTVCSSLPRKKVWLGELTIQTWP